MNLSDLIRGFINGVSLENVEIAPTRDSKKRWEIPAALLYAKCKTSTLDEDIHTLKNILIRNQNDEYMWDEYSYGIDDESVGYSGLVTTSFVLLSLVEYYKRFENLEVLNALLKSADAVYSQENNGYIVKAKTNKSDVLNTNLLGAMALKEISMILPDSSIRRRLYDELSRRVVRKVLSYQSPSGKFPYHFESRSVPVLYQSMVTAQFRFLIAYYDDEIIHKSVLKSQKSLELYFKDNGYIDWDLANNHDKRGAMWAYSFALASTDDVNLERKLFKILSEHSANKLFHGLDNTPQEDKFFSAWIIFGLVWATDEENIKNNFRIITNLKYAFLKVEYFLRSCRFYCKYLKNKVYNFPFDSGALENRFWLKDP